MPASQVFYRMFGISCRSPEVLCVSVASIWDSDGHTGEGFIPAPARHLLDFSI